MWQAPRSPAWDLGLNAIDLLLAHGFLYDCSLMGADYIPYRACQGDTVELGEPYSVRRGNFLDRDADQLVTRRLSAFRIHSRRNDDPAGVTIGAQRDAELKRVPLHEEDRRVGRVDLHNAPLRDRRGYRVLAFQDLVAKLIRERAVSPTTEEAAMEAQKRLFSWFAYGGQDGRPWDLAVVPSACRALFRQHRPEPVGKSASAERKQKYSRRCAHHHEKLPNSGMHLFSVPPVDQRKHRLTHSLGVPNSLVGCHPPYRGCSMVLLGA